MKRVVARWETSRSGMKVEKGESKRVAEHERQNVLPGE